MNAIIHECGNGLPGVGDVLENEDGECFQIVSVLGDIQTPGFGRANYVRAIVEGVRQVDPSEVFPARLVLGIGG
jgi:hypothetical protein